MFIEKERAGLEKKFFDLCNKVVSDNQLSLYDLEYLPGSQTLRVYILDESTGSAELKDCVTIDRALSPFFEEESWMPENVTLEVSSPGLFRQLNTKKHFERVKGQNIKISTMKSFDSFGEVKSKKLIGQKKAVVKLVDVSSESILVEFDKEQVNIKFEEIKKANLETEI